MASVSFGPKGRFVSGGIDRTIRIWNRDATVRRRSRAHPRTIHAVDYSPRGDRVASGCDDGVIRVFDAHTGDILRSIPTHRGAIRDVRFRADGSSLLSVASDGAIACVDVHRGTVRQRRTLCKGSIGSLALSPDGTWIAAGCSHGRVHLLDPRDLGGRRRLIHAHDASVVSLAAGPDGRLASADRAGHVCLIDARKGRAVHGRKAHDGAVYGLVFLDRGRGLATAGRDRRICLWTVEDRRRL